MKKSLLFVIAGTAMFLSCAKENITPEDSSVKTVITVGIDESKTTIGESESGKHKIYWANGDILNVNGVSSDALSGIGEKQTSASFTFTGLLEKPYNFLYPSAYYKTAGTISLPSTQDASVADLPMYGYSASGLSANLKVLTAALQISLKQGTDTDNIKYIQLSSETQPLSGTFTIDYTTGEITSTAAAADSKIRLSANCALSSETATTFVFSIPAGSYDLTVKVVDVNAHCMTKTLTDRTFTAGNYIILPELVFAPTTTEFDIHITTAAEWNAFAEKFNNWKYTDDPTVSVSIDNDIDFTGVTPTLIGAYGLKVDNYCSALIDGNSHSFKNITKCDHPLVASLNTDGIIRNLTIDETCSFASDLNDTARQHHFAPFCEYLKGTLSGCVNKASVTVSPASSTTYSKGNYVGGLVGRIREGKIENCTNSGTITFGANCIMPSGEVSGVGGLAGYISNNDGSIENSTNTGTIAVAATSPTLYVGGIVGRHYGSVDACTNSGSVSVSTARADDDPCKKIFFGGIAGILADAVASIESCTNSGSITSSSNVKIQEAGGIVGDVADSGTIAGNTNSGDITFSAAARQIMAGGIIGSLDNGGTYTFTGTPATGQITVSSIESSSYTYLYVGGLIGRVVPLNNPVIKGDELASVCNISLTASAKKILRGGMGGIVGALNLESTTDPTSVTIQDCDVSFKKNAGVRVPISDAAFMPARIGVGGILGYAITGVKITDCDFGSAVNISKGNKSNGYSADCGGIVGRLEGGESEISNCTVPSSGYIYNSHYNNNIVGNTGNATGGIIGRAIGTSISITGCSCAATMYAFRCAIGGIGGYLSNATVKGCTITGAITQGNYAGGLVGYASASTFGGDSEGDACTFNCASGIISTIAGSCYNYAGGLAGQTVSSCKFINCGSYFGTTNGVTAAASGTSTQGNAPGSLIGNSDAGTTVTSCKAGGVMNCTLWGMPGASSVTSATLDATTVVSYAVGNLGFTPTSANVALWDGK